MADTILAFFVALVARQCIKHLYHWQQLFTVSLVTVRFDVQLNGLLIRRAAANDSGLYACKTWNVVGEAWMNFSLSVTGKQLYRI